VEIVWDLINVLREYLKVVLDETEASGGNKKIQNKAVSNILTGLLCAF
jgi:hypothetical protein